MTASQTNYEEACREVAFRNMEQSPLRQQAEKIARHYLAHAEVAKTIMSVIETVEPCEASDQLLAHLVGLIKSNHLHDFGIALEWRNLDTLKTPTQTQSA